MFLFRDTREGGVGDPRVTHVAFTDARLDLAEGAPEQDLVRLREELDVPIVRMRQVHGCEVAVVHDAERVPTEADALVTDHDGIALLVRVADCVPILLADPAHGMIAAVHAGRTGMALGVVPRTLERLRGLGAVELTAWVGPHICGGCYEVPDALRSEVAALVPEAWAQTRWGTPALDIGAGVSAQLRAAGCEVIPVGRCTLEDPELHSYRRDAADSGRFGGLIWVAA
ncbi:polyphenol oxidase family protein [Nocardioides sp.]|uniref:polyphenol oxidase family protein n=1 Tax=Nocardioides sp. TaxID=35761 RepID=UPI003D0B5C4B